MTSSDFGEDKPKVLVVQLGARHRYSVPRMLHQRGCLVGLYTDSYRGSLIGNFASALSVFGGSWKRLKGRNVGPIPKRMIRSTDLVTTSRLYERFVGKRRTEISQLIQDSFVLSRKMIQWGLPPNTTHVYSMFSENIDFIEWASSQGVKCMVDIYTTPYRDKIVNDECIRLSMDSLCVSEEDTTRELAILSKIVGCASYLLCPSTIVAKAMNSMFADSRCKTHVIPYASTLPRPEDSCQPIPGRILFVGQDPIRKGLYRLAEAVGKLQANGSKLQLRVVGEIPKVFKEDARLSTCTFVGKLDRKGLVDEYQKADIFVLPSLAEGCVAAVSESIAVGCPVIVSRECGIDFVEEEVHGIFVSPKSTDEIEHAIDRIISNRSFRNDLADGCRKCITMPTMKSWGDSLAQLTMKTQANSLW